MTNQEGEAFTPSQEKEEKEPVIDPKLLGSIQEISQIFEQRKQPLWVVGSMAIAAHLGRPHRDIVHDIDLMTTDKHIHDIINDLRGQGFIVEQTQDYKFRISSPPQKTQADLIIFHQDPKTGQLENSKFSFPAEGFPNETKILNGVKMQPISLELLSIMKERDVQKSGGRKHVDDLEVIKKEMKRQGMEDSLAELRQKVNFK